MISTVRLSLLSKVKSYSDTSGSLALLGFLSALDNIVAYVLNDTFFPFAGVRRARARHGYVQA